MDQSSEPSPGSAFTVPSWFNTARQPLETTSITPPTMAEADPETPYSNPPPSRKIYPTNALGRTLDPPQNYLVTGQGGSEHQIPVRPDGPAVLRGRAGLHLHRAG